jgi:hypothetical protein
MEGVRGMRTSNQVCGLVSLLLSYEKEYEFNSSEFSMRAGERIRNRKK